MHPIVLYVSWYLSNTLHTHTLHKHTLDSTPSRMSLLLMQSLKTLQTCWVVPSSKPFSSGCWNQVPSTCSQRALHQAFWSSVTQLLPNTCFDPQTTPTALYTKRGWWLRCPSFCLGLGLPLLMVCGAFGGCEGGWVL